MFKGLESLEMEIRYNYIKYDNVKLSLPKLKYLEIDYIKNGNYKIRNKFLSIEFDTPLLHSLKLRHPVCGFIFTYPLSIKFLSILMYKDYYLIFENIRYLECQFTSELDLNILNFKKLRELHVLSLCSDLSAIANQNREPNIQALKIYQYGVLINNNEYDYDYRKHCNLELGKDFYEVNNRHFSFLMNNYSNISDKLHFMNFIDYSLLMDITNDHLPADFFKKFFNINFLRVKGKVKDQDQLFRFISRLNLHRLVLIDSDLNQSFYNNLASVCSLSCLEFFENDKINFKFINNMHRLIVLVTNQELLLDVIELNRLQYLKYINFKNENLSIEILKKGRNKYGLIKEENQRYNKDKISYLELISLCHELKYDKIDNWIDEEPAPEGGNRVYWLFENIRKENITKKRRAEKISQ
jgi:hypothetical protein